MINLLNEKLRHPYFNTEWTVIGYENGKLQCVSDKSSVTEWITREYGLELYAEDQKKRADELELLIENFLYANQYSDIYAIQSEEEFREKYEKLKSR